jgi:hypothetical protein
MTSRSQVFTELDSTLNQAHQSEAYSSRVLSEAAEFQSLVAMGSAKATGRNFLLVKALLSKRDKKEIDLQELEQ